MSKTPPPYVAGHGLLAGIVKNEAVATPLEEITGRTRPADARLLELARVMAI